MKHELPKLPYGFEALEPYIDAKTMEIHYTKHHQAYVDKLNSVIEKYPELQEKSVVDLLKEISTLPVSDADRKVIQNHGGGHANHTFFWEIMSPTKETDLSLVDEISTTFGSVEEFKKQFTEAATARFGSGWAWLVRHEGTREMEICTTANQDSPLMTHHIPVIGLDLWEHAYYLKYQNRRAEYIENWWNALKLI